MSDILEQFRNQEIQIHLASEEERDLVFDVLHEHGFVIYEWDQDISEWPWIHFYSPMNEHRKVSGCRGIWIKNPISAEEFLAGMGVRGTEVDPETWEALL